jgi:hypothetical protein
MSTVLPETSSAHSASFNPPFRLPRWFREPLLHFMVLGAVLFIADYLINAGADDPHLIVVDSKVDQEAKQIFVASRGRDPNQEELTALRKVWLDNEILYREGLAMQVDKGDSAIRDRVIFKALSVIDANVKLPAAGEKTLRDWFEQNRNKYDEPTRFDFDEAALVGEQSEAQVRDLVHRLNTGTPGDVQAGLRVFKGRPEQNLVQSYGEDFAKQLKASSSGEWQAMKTREGWRAIRLNTTVQAQPANFDALRGVILQDWTDATAAEQRTAAVGALANN